MSFIDSASNAISAASDATIGKLYLGSPVVNYHYSMLVEAVYNIPLRSVRAFTKNNNYERIQEGGVNDYVTLKRMPITEMFTFQVERYITSAILDPLSNGSELTLPIVLNVMKGTNFTDNRNARMYIFSGCTVTGKEYGELNAERSGLATEVITIAYRSLYVVPNVLSLGGDR